MWILPLTGNRFAWCVGGPDPHLLTPEDGGDQSSQHSSRGSSQGSRSGREWYPETAVEICEDVRNFICPYGGSVMEIIEATPMGLTSKVLLEEKMYRTWYSGRVVLVGDACHKIVPFFGQGASQAILDCACLVNMLVELKTASVPELADVFQKYVEARSETARVASDSSREFADLIYDQGFKADVARNIVLRFTPNWLLRMITGTVTSDRPTLNFLPPPRCLMKKDSRTNLLRPKSSKLHFSSEPPSRTQSAIFLPLHTQTQ
ncbi:hypothetical protein BGW38_006624, partial [Lunasporangiospora selenospora]